MPVGKRSNTPENNTFAAYFMHVKLKRDVRRLHGSETDHEQGIGLQGS